MKPEIMDALEAGCGVEPHGHARPHMPPGTTLGDWKVMDPPASKSATTLRRQLIAVLRELPEDMTVSDLRVELED